MKMNANLVDSTGRVLARASVQDEGKFYGGCIDLEMTPANVRTLFNEFEEIVNGQMFSFLDEIQGRMEMLHIKVQFDDGRVAPVTDLQVFPSTGEVSFRLANLPSAAVKGA